MGDGAETELCTNCQRQIPVANFTIHSVHCTRNLKVCHKCKEPVPVSDMKKHTAYVPCKQCGERMQACDVSPHQREACPQTGITCNYCEIELARVVMRDHEAYCGSRTERCDECGELVMIKYRKLHEETNHGFLKLDDEPGPQPSWMLPAQTPRNLPVQAAIKPLNTAQINRYVNGEKSNRAEVPQSSSERRISFSTSTFGEASGSACAASTQPHLEDHAITALNFKNAQTLHERLKKNSSKHASSASSTNIVPPSSTTREVDAAPANGRVQKVVSKKYPAPQPPAEDVSRITQSRLNTAFIAPSAESSSNSKPSASFKHTRDVPMYAATLREQKQAEERKRQTEINLMQGLPPVLNPAQKLDKLRKLSALQNNAFDSEAPRNTGTNTNGGTFTPMSEDDLMNRLQKLYDNKTDGSVASVNPVNLNRLNQKKSVGVKNTNNQFPRNEGGPQDSQNHYYEPIGDPSSSVIPSRSSNSPQQLDRFSEIKNGLHILRKELKKCSSPLEPRRSSDANMSDLPRPRVLRLNSDNNNPGAAEGPPRVLRDRNIQDAPHQRLESDSGRPQQTPRTKKEKNHKKDQQRLRGERRSSSDVQVTCEFCNRNMSYVEIQDHEVDCQMKMQREMERRDSRGAIAENATMLPANAPFNQPFMDVPADLEGVMLPCEFCHQSIPADMFVTHETGCNPLETSILSPTALAARKNIDKNFTAPLLVAKNTNLERSNSRRSNQTQEHSSNKKDRTNLNRQNRSTEHSALEVPRGQHYISRDRREEINAEGAFGFGDEEVQLPCEFCSSLMPAGMLMVHQEQCGTV